MSSILHLGKYYHPDKGGIESVTKSLAEAAVHNGHSVTVLCFSKFSDKIDLLNGVRIISSRILFIFAQQPIGFRYFFRAIIESRRADIIHLHAPNMLALFSTLFLPRKATIIIHWHSDVINKGLIAKLLKPLEYYTLQKSTAIIAATEVYANSSEDLVPFKSKVTVIPYGVDDLLNSEKEIPSHIITKVNSRKIILSIGRLVPYKGFDVLIDAAIKLPIDTVIVIVGTGPLHNHLSNKIRELNLADKVLLAGKLDDSELSYLLSVASIYCFPSTYRAEAFGVVLLEALAYSLPLVVSDIPGSGAPWINKHGESGLNFDVGNPLSLSSSCCEILENSMLRNKLKTGARNRFLNEFTSEIFHKRFMDLYNTLLFSKR